MQKSFVWEGLLYDTEEHCSVSYTTDKIVVRSEIEGWLHTTPVYVEYVIELDAGWRVNCIKIDFTLSTEKHSYDFEKKETGWTDLSGADCADFGNAEFVDISLTPLTNTLPVKALHLNVGEAREIEVLYIDVQQNALSLKKQKYTRLDADRFLYENTENDFRAEITVDADGFVTDYPSLFKMLKPY